MISYGNLDLIEELFASIFQYGFDKMYSPKSVESRLCASKLVSSLEKNSDSIIDNYNSDQIIRDIFNISDEEKIEVRITDLAYWISMTYLNLFFQYKKSFSYLFLYFPLEDAVERFPLYHEMDVSQIFNYFESKQKSQTLLSKLLNEKGLTTKQLSVLSGISIHTLNGYSKSDDILYGARFDYIMFISQILEVNPNIFMKNIYISIPAISKLSKNEEAMIRKDTYLFFNTQELGFDYEYDMDDESLVSKEKVIKFYTENNTTYEDIVKLVDEYMKHYSKVLVVANDKKTNKSLKSNKQVISISDTEIVDSKGRSKLIPSIIKEFALIKAKKSYYKVS